MLLLLDLGNSRLKWALVDGSNWVAEGALPKQDIGALTLTQWQMLPRPSVAIGVNSGGEGARVRIEAQLARWRLQPKWLVPTVRECGVRNGYQIPTQLGADRWAALIAAWQRVRAPAVVVSAGTALTVDALDALGGEGYFRGGLIIPGLRIMREALAQNTSALKVLPGTFEAFPRSTADAMWSGAIHATCGAIERVRASLRGSGAGAIDCVLTGGGASEFASQLTGPVMLVENLVLEGVLAIATANSVI